MWGTIGHRLFRVVCTKGKENTGIKKKIFSSSFLFSLLLPSFSLSHSPSFALPLSPSLALPLSLPFSLSLTSSPFPTLTSPPSHLHSLHSLLPSPSIPQGFLPVLTPDIVRADVMVGLSSSPCLRSCCGQPCLSSRRGVASTRGMSPLKSTNYPITMETCV